MKKVINILLSFFMAILIFGFGVCFAGAITTSSPFIKLVVAVSNYTSNAETEIADALKSVAIPSGLPEDFFSDKIKTEFIKTTIDQSIDASLGGKEYKMPQEEIEKLIYNDIVSYAKENGTELNDESTQMLKNTASLAADYYKNYTYNIFYRVLKHLNGISLKLFIGAFILAILNGFMVYLLKGKKEFSHALTGGGLMLILPIIFVITGGAFKWGINSVALLSFINFIIGFIILFILLLGAALIFIGVKYTIKFLKESQKEEQ